MNGKFQDHGQLFDDFNNIQYDGYWVAGQKTGEGIQHCEDEKGDIYLNYCGFWKKGNKSGYGKLFNQSSSLIYGGYFEDNKREGRGIEYYRNGKIKYFGVFKNDKIYKLGKEFYSNGVSYCNGFDADTFNNGMKNGNATILNKNGGVLYNGRFVDDEPNGFGIIYYENGFKKYQGVLKQTGQGTIQCHGKGIEYHPNGKKRFKGEWKFNMKDGFGYEYNEEGNLIRKGSWKSNEFHAINYNFFAN